MIRRKLIVPGLVVAFGLSAVVVSIAQADPAKDIKAATAGADSSPGFSKEEMEAFEKASTLGAQHKAMANDVGKWEGKQQMWMKPGMEPITEECSSTVSSVFDGRYLKVEFTSNIPGIGPYKGQGNVAFDNVSQKYQATWLDNMSTGIAFGTGELSADGKTLTINYECNCPLTKKPVAMRQVETWTSPTTKVMEMFGTDPTSGKEFKTMRVEFKKVS
jgi:hypothetical protein